MLSQDEASARVTEALDRFDEAWRRTPAPPIDDFLPPPGDPERGQVLRDLVHSDIEYRWKAGLGVPVEDYLARYPDLASDASLVADLAAQEFHLRRRSDPALRPEEYVKRFPRHADEIADRLLAATTGASGPPTHDINGHGLPPSLPPGYEAMEELGRGGMGVVLKARQIMLNRLVAVKLIRADLSRHPTARLRFDAEARAVASLEHPGIVRVYDGGVHAGHPFLVMEHVPGGTLAARLRSGTLDPRAAAELVVSLARAVHYAHQNGVIHRDIKPANILMGEGRAATPRLTDFGLARQLEGGMQTVQGDLLGTPAYMAPEQAAGRSAQVGPATDVYGLGAVLYECLTGRAPHAGETRDAAIKAAARGEVEPPRRIDPHLPAGLERICLRALSADPAERHASAEALAVDLERWLSRRVRMLRVGLSVALASLLVTAGIAAALLRAPAQRPGGTAKVLPFPRSLEPEARVLPEPRPLDPDRPLRGLLTFKVLTRKKHWEEVTEKRTDAVPVRNGDKIRVEAELSRPAYAYLLYHDGSGKTYALYPWNPDGKFRVGLAEPPPSEEAVREAMSPRPNAGYPVRDASSLDTVILIANRTPLTQDDRDLIVRQLARLKGAKSTAPYEVFERDYSGGKLDRSAGWSRDRGIDEAAVDAVDRPFDDAILPIARRVDVLKAIRFSHWNEEEDGQPPPRPEKDGDE